jgi:flagellar motor switch protein FliN/FliY
MTDDTANVDPAPPAPTASTESGDASPATPAVEAGALDQAEVEALLNQSGTGAKAAAAATPPPSPSRPPASAADEDASQVTQEDLEALLNQAEAAISSINQPTGDAPPGIAPFEFRQFSGSPPSPDAATVQLISDVQLDLDVELGRTHMYLEDVLKLGKGGVVTLDKLAGDPVDIYANGRLIARGEVLVLNDNFCVRVAELVTGDPQPT